MSTFGPSSTNTNDATNQPQPPNSAPSVASSIDNSYYSHTTNLTTLTARPPTIQNADQKQLNSPLSPQEELLDIQNCQIKERNLNEIKQQCSTLISELEGNNHPEIIIKKHIQQLKKYNELKDIALELISMIADHRQVKTTDILNEMKVELGDDSI
ncbi:unnamed protein product [Candida verbasci]|uniref:Swi5-domain-containing protein n=1 Tax=Candida verbasci TaxID=1227364 RepID=A0A9W4TR56_9ASCO|nr:unnamed protein product [Candida verbasci]